ncbi:MAG TPA: cupredoxin family copper-binding protein [Rhodanobacteraceae bacterium]|jgi:plastocyanin|nr:cupredoxin family copper-binding protein [Rhodanobacteraceae bacterium]
MQRLFAAAALLLAALSTQAASPKPAVYQVGIRNFHFQPMQRVVPAGSTVTWTNHDEEPHVVTSTGGQFKSSPALDTDDRYSAVFTRPGTYAYYCSIHPQMTGTIVVK